MSSNVKKDGASYWIRVAIWLAISVMGWFLPAGEIVTAYGVKTTCIFAGLMFGWICLDLIYPSLLAVILMAFAGGTAVANGFYAGFAYEIVVIIFTNSSLFTVALGLNSVSLTPFIISSDFKVYIASFAHS